MTKHEKHFIDNRDKVPESSDELLRSLVKILKIKSLTFHGKVYENAVNQNEKPQGTEKWYIPSGIMKIFSVDEAVTWRNFIKKVPLIISKNSQENSFAGVFFY